MADAPRITIRLAPKLLKAAESRAKSASVTLGEYVRALVEADTGIVVAMPRGLAKAKKSVRKDVSQQGVTARWGESEK